MKQKVKRIMLIAVVMVCIALSTYSVTVLLNANEVTYKNTTVDEALKNLYELEQQVLGKKEEVEMYQANYIEKYGRFLEEIEITQGPTKTEYSIGEEFDKAGMTVIASYNNNTNEDVTGNVSSATIDGSTNKVVISYEENGITKTAEQEITVNYPEFTIDVSNFTTSGFTITSDAGTVYGDLLQNVTYYVGESENDENATAYETGTITGLTANETYYVWVESEVGNYGKVLDSSNYGEVDLREHVHETTCFPRETVYHPIHVTGYSDPYGSFYFDVHGCLCGEWQWSGSYNPDIFCKQCGSSITNALRVQKKGILESLLLLLLRFCDRMVLLEPKWTGPILRHMTIMLISTRE